MPIFLKKDKRILFVHIPKAAGSSLKKIMEKQGYEMTLDTAECPYFFKCCPQHFEVEQLKKLGLMNCDYAFTIVRNPEDRIISEYYYRKMPEKKIALNTFIRAALLWYKLDPYCFGNHIRPQGDFIDKHVDRYYLEDGMQSILNKLASKGVVDLEVTPIQVNTSKTKKSITLSRGSIGRIYKMYEYDYKLLNYSKPDFSQYDPTPFGKEMEEAVKATCLVLYWIVKKCLLRRLSVDKKSRLKSLIVRIPYVYNRSDG